MVCLINSFEKAKEFVITANLCEGDINIIQGKYVVDGKSIVGLLSLDLSKTLDVQCINPLEQGRFEEYKVA